MLDIEGTAASLARKQRMLPVVRFAVERRLAAGAPDYWDLATLLELDVLDGRPDDARKWLDRALAGVREPWEAGTTAGNLTYIHDARRARGQHDQWLAEAIEVLRARATAG